jgi:RNA polymerase sigma-70 factor (ECF subfamily)
LRCVSLFRISAPELWNLSGPSGVYMVDTGLAAAGVGSDEDALLVKGCRAGDRTAFNRLVLKYQDRIVSLCVRLAGSLPDGQDAAQEVFVKAFRSIGLFKGESRFSTWLYRIAVNTVRNQRRSWWHRLWSASSHAGGAGEGFCEEIADSGALPDAELQRKRIGRAIGRALLALPARGRELVVLRDIQGLSYEEIEAATGMKLGTVKSGLARAREALRRELSGVMDERS